LLSAKKQRKMTQLEVEAQKIVNNQDSDDVEVTDDARY